MSEWIRTRLKWLIAGDEMAEVERWRVRCSEYDRWLAEYPDITLVLQNLRGVAQGRLESMGIELNVPWPTDAPGPWGINALRVKVTRMRDGIGESRREPQDERAAFLAWARTAEVGQDESWAWAAWQARAGITPQAGKESGE